MGILPIPRCHKAFKSKRVEKLLKQPLPQNFCFKSFAERNKKRTFALAKRQCPDGGIGRRAGLKHQWGNPSRFEPGSGYSRRLRVDFNA